MLQRGERLPDARIWLAPQEQVSLGELVEQGPALLLFYLFDWSASQ